LIQTSYTLSIRQKALELGFSDIGFTKVSHLSEEEEHLKQWLDAGFNAGMKYMENHFEKRVDPAKLVPGAKTVISVLLNYYPAETQKHNDAPVISKYAYGRDYHYTVKEKLKKLFDFIKEDIYPGLEGRYFTDSAPVLDRAWAVRAGLGWIGKNSNLINKKWGSFVFIGELIVNIELEEERQEVKNACGTCTRCIDACPTGALVKPYTVDANKCTSYLTIEHKGEIPEQFKGKFDNRVFGCDICQDVCPWNRKLTPSSEPDFKLSERFIDLTAQQFYDMGEQEFNEIFSHSPLKRTKYEGFRRNLLFLDKS
jgi:epoxyqueuosine reductase